VLDLLAIDRALTANENSSNSSDSNFFHNSGPYRIIIKQTLALNRLTTSAAVYAKPIQKL
jgi:hypothetical protein